MLQLFPSFADKNEQIDMGIALFINNHFLGLESVFSTFFSSRRITPDALLPANTPSTSFSEN